MVALRQITFEDLRRARAVAAAQVVYAYVRTGEVGRSSCTVARPCRCDGCAAFAALMDMADAPFAEEQERMRQKLDEHTARTAAADARAAETWRRRSIEQRRDSGPEHRATTGELVGGLMGGGR